jgi:GNAT superfamily N-acetyltransferase
MRWEPTNRPPSPPRNKGRAGPRNAMSRSFSFRWVLSPSDVDPGLPAKLASCWMEVANAGGAVGFPFIPVTRDQVASRTEHLLQALDPHATRLLVALDSDELLGWLVLERNRSRLTSHWARVSRVQTALARRGAGVGKALMEEVARSARDDLNLEHLHLELRSGAGLEGFYQSCGWREVGRWPAALRLDVDDDRDEVLMLLEL